MPKVGIPKSELQRRSAALRMEITRLKQEETNHLAAATITENVEALKAAASAAESARELRLRLAQALREVDTKKNYWEMRRGKSEVA